MEFTSGEPITFFFSQINTTSSVDEETAKQLMMRFLTSSPIRDLMIDLRMLLQIRTLREINIAKTYLNTGVQQHCERFFAYFQLNNILGAEFIGKFKNIAAGTLKSIANQESFCNQDAMTVQLQTLELVSQFLPMIATNTVLTNSRYKAKQFASENMPTFFKDSECLSRFEKDTRALLDRSSVIFRYEIDYLSK